MAAYQFSSILLEKCVRKWAQKFLLSYVCVYSNHVGTARDSYVYKMAKEHQSRPSDTLRWYLPDQLCCSSTLQTLRKLMARRMTDALSSWEVTEAGKGRLLASSKKTSVSLLRRQRAASRDFSLRFSEFLHTFATKTKTLSLYPTDILDT